MQATTVPLVVELNRYPQKARKTAEDTAKLIHKVLSQLNYSGKWLISLNNQLTKREDFRFKVIARRGTNIICRTKPGDNGTCWECTLMPPRGWLLDQVFSDLRMVPASGEMLRAPAIRPNDLNLGNGKPLEPKTVGKIFTNQEVLQETKPPATLTIPVKDKIPTPSVIPEAVKIVTVSLPEAPKKVLMPQQITKLDLDGSKITTIGDDTIALTHGLVAVCLGLDAGNGAILRQTAVKLLVQELNLPNFVQQNPKYNDPIKAGTILISALCRKGYFGRWRAAQRKQTRVRETTKGYLLTPFGREKLEAFRPLLPQSIASRLFKPSDVVFQNLDFEVPPEEEDEEISSPATNLVNVSDKLRLMQPLMEKLQQHQRSLTDCDAMVTDYDSQRKKIEKDLTPMETRLAELAAEQARLKPQADKMRIQLDRLMVDLTSMQQLRKEEAAALETVQSQLRKYIA